MSKDENGNRDSELTEYILGEMRKNGEAWSVDKSKVKTECLGLILLQYADRLEEAIKREKGLAQLHCKMSKALEGHKKKQKQFGNTAAMREACVNIAGYAQTAKCHTEDGHILGYLDQIEKWAKSAIAAPVRNCDVYTTSGEAGLAITEYCSKMAETGECVKSCPYRESEGGCAFGWLLAATGTKGEADGGGAC